MCPHAQTDRTSYAALLLAGYGLFWALWALHPVFDHENHRRGAPVCHHGPGEKHFHDERYARHECQICHYLPAQAAVLDIPVELEWNFGQPALRVLHGPVAPSTFARPCLYLRGPPLA